MRIEKLERVKPFTTKDGSEIRELAGIPTGNAENQSLAEATVPLGGETEEHYHRLSEEIYFFTHGSGRLRLDDDESDVAAGDTVVIPPGTRHKLWNTGTEPLKLLCCCSPAYSHNDTVLTD
jgi:mannose-6-phosphate isomerase-like protein (cupin superfamily)